MQFLCFEVFWVKIISYLRVYTENCCLKLDLLGEEKNKIRPIFGANPLHFDAANFKHFDYSALVTKIMSKYMHFCR